MPHSKNCTSCHTHLVWQDMRFWGSRVTVLRSQSYYYSNIFQEPETGRVEIPDIPSLDLHYVKHFYYGLLFASLSISPFLFTVFLPDPSSLIFLAAFL